MSETVRKNIYLTEIEIEQIEAIQQKHKLNSIGKVVSYLLENYSESVSGITQAQMVASLVKAELKEYYDILRTRTGYTDKYTKILLHMLNDMVINQGWDLPEDSSSLSIEDTPSLLFSDAKRHYEESMKRYNEQKQLKAGRRQGGIANE